jgi:hypothetical protein
MLIAPRWEPHSGQVRHFYDGISIFIRVEPTYVIDNNIFRFSTSTSLLSWTCIEVVTTYFRWAQTWARTCFIIRNSELPKACAVILSLVSPPVQHRFALIQKWPKGPFISHNTCCIASLLYASHCQPRSWCDTIIAAWVVSSPDGKKRLNIYCASYLLIVLLHFSFIISFLLCRLLS